MKRINKKNKVVHQVILIIIMCAFNLFSYSHNVAVAATGIASFAAQWNSSHDRVELNWETGSEKNTSNYTIQRSTDGVNFDDVELIFTQEENASLKNNYHFTDDITKINSEKYYYRLKVVDMNGKFSYTQVELMEAGESEQGPSMITHSYLMGGRIFVSIPDSWQNKTVAYHIYTADGNLVKGKINSSAGEIEALNILDLPNGAYTLKMIAGPNMATQNFNKVN
jgi:hypothetical protein